MGEDAEAQTGAMGLPQVSSGRVRIQTQVVWFRTHSNAIVRNFVTLAVGSSDTDFLKCRGCECRNLNLCGVHDTHS